MTSPALTQLEQAMARLAPYNLAPIPLAFSQELDARGRPQWAAYLHVRQEGRPEYEIEVRNPDLTVVLTNAHYQLIRQHEAYA